MAITNVREADGLYPRPGDLIDGKYRCEQFLGFGGMGAVARATHTLRKASVALKFIHPAVAQNDDLMQRFINEAVAASRIDSEHVVKIFDVSRLPDGTPFLVMEYLEGCDLSDLLARDGTPGLESVPRCIHFASQILRGLQVAHDAGIVHRDMKPSNCFVIEREGDPDFVKLLDFGISKLEQPGGVKLTQTNAFLGTPLYMAPEQAHSAKAADVRSDLYAVGVMLYELLSGHPPFDSEGGGLAELLVKAATSEPIPIQDRRPDLSPALARVIRKTFARVADDRFPSAFLMSEALAPWADERSHAVLEASRRRAARSGHSWMPSPLPPAPSAPPPDAHVAHSASAWPPPHTELVQQGPVLQTGGATSTVGDAPAPPRVRRSNATLATLGFVSAAVSVGLTGWLLRGGVGSAGSGDAATSPSESSALLVGQTPETIHAPIASTSASMPPSASAPLVVVAEPEASAAAPSGVKRQPTPRHSAATGIKAPRLGDITIVK